MADELWVDILPAMGRFGPQLARDATRAARTAGDQSGAAYSQAFDSGAAGAGEAAVKELEATQKKAAGLVSKLSGDVSKSREAQQKSAATLILAEQKLTDTVAKFGAESAQAQAATLRLEASRSAAKTAADRFTNAEDALKEAQKSLTAVTKDLETAQTSANEEVRQAPGLWGKLGAAMGTAGGKVKEFAKGTGGMVTQLAGAVGGVALLKEAFGGAMEKQTVISKLNAQLAATPEQAAAYGDSTGKLYARGFGESMADVSGSVDAVVSSMQGMKNASAGDIEKITGYAMNLAEAFDVDVAEAATTAGSLMKNGLAADATSAMDLITGAMQKVPQSLRGEILPIMDEYGKHFTALGIDGETAMGMVVASSADGAIGMDKMGDALKEFTIRGTDMSKSTTGVFKELGLNSKQMTNDLLAGGDQSKAAMGKIVEGLQSIKDPGEQAAAAVSLFGTPLEDLGTDKIPEFLGMIDPMGDAFDSTAGAADKMAGTLNGGAATSLETIKRSFMTMLSDGVAPALAPLENVLKWATTTPGVMQAVGVALGLVALAWAAVTLAASPWLAIGVGIALVIGGIVLAVMNWGSVMNWLGGVWKSATTLIGNLWGGMVNGIKTGWNNVAGPVIQWASDKITWLKNGWKLATGLIGTLWGGMVNGVKSAYNTTLGVVLGWVLDKVNWLKGGWQLGTKLIASAWTGMTTGVRDGWNNTLKGVMGFVNGGINGVRDIWKAATGKISGVWSGLVSGVRSVWDKSFKPIFDIIGKVVKGDFVGAFDSAKKSVGKVWTGIANIVRKPINFVVDTVYNNGLRAVFNKIASLVGIGQLPKADGIPAFAKGGLHKGGWALVGEEGPELVNFSNPGRVYTAGETAGMLAGREQAPMGALPMLAGATKRQAVVPAGGLGGDLWGGIKSVGSAIGGGIKKAVGGAVDWVRGGLAKAAEPAVNLIKNGLGTALGTTGFGGWINKAAGKALDGSLTWIRGKDKAANAEMGAGGGGPQFNGPRGPAHRPSKGPFTSGYGPRWGSFHAGVDIAGGGPTRAYQNGTVAKTGWNIGPGRTGIGILLSHGDNFYTYYGHNPVGGVKVKPGQQVKGGQVIGAQGATGNVTGTHLHWETHQGRPWANKNPMPYLYDGGGVLQPGYTPILNKTRKPEMIYTQSQNQALTALAARGAATVDGAGNINVTIDVKDLEGLRTLEEFVNMARRRARQKVGA